MAVTKIRKISSWTLLVLLVVSVAVCLAFFVGGVELDAAGNKVYVNTDLVLYWGYALVALTLIATIVFAIVSLIQGFRTNPKRALQSLLVFIVLIVILGITYAIGDGTPMSVNEDSAQYNTPGWLKIIDMCIYTTYTLVALIVVGVIWGGIRKRLSK